MRNHACKQKGLSLLELLVVLLIIGTLVSFAIPAFVSDDIDSQIDKEARRLTTLLRLARDEAVLSAREYAIEFTADSYTFYMLGKDNQWLSLEKDAVLRQRVLPSAIQMDVLIMGEDMTLDTRKSALTARIYMLSSGEITPFEIHLHAQEAEHPYHVTGSPGGEISVAAGEEAA